MKSEILLSENTCKYSCIEKGCRKNLHATIPKSNTGYDQYSAPDAVAVKSTFVTFLQFSSRTFMGSRAIILFSFELKNSVLKTTNNTFGDQLVHFFLQPFSKQLCAQCHILNGYYEERTFTFHYFSRVYVSFLFHLFSFLGLKKRNLYCCQLHVQFIVY